MHDGSGDPSQSPALKRLGNASTSGSEIMNFDRRRTVPSRVHRISFPGKAFLAFFLLAAPAAAGENDIQITLKPRNLVSGKLAVPVTTGGGIDAVDLLVNGVPYGRQTGRSVVFHVDIGKYIRRLRIRAVGLDRDGRSVAVDEMTVNDPQPPFRIRLQSPSRLPAKGKVILGATVLSPPNVPVQAVDFYVGETLIATAATIPYRAEFEASDFQDVRYARAVARSAGALEANDVVFWGEGTFEQLDVVVKHLPLSVFGNTSVELTKEDLTLNDAGYEREIEALIPAADQPLNVIMLIDSSESMLDQLPVIQEAGRQFARSVIRKNDRIAVVAFHERVFWLTGFTSNLETVDAAIGKLKPQGQTHLYDAVISMLYELQKMPGRKALVILSDGMNLGGTFELDHLVHYARYAGVPIYPIIKNKWLSRIMRLRIGMNEVRRFAAIARDSGASYFIIERPAELPRVYAAIAEELQRQYLLVFRTESTGADSWHPLSVSTSKKVNIRIPRGYFP
ncbi:MAG TPA: VWA domain-containing protein [Thermoanaerobaculia bacterium]|nr:VWA domain-containing protein [Thermoanaerobaculia bacterium]